MDINKIDLDNPQWCWAWDDDIRDKCRRVFVAELSDGCIVYNDVHNEAQIFKHYELITEPKYRPFLDEAEFIEHCKTRTDMWILENGHMYTLSTSRQNYSVLFNNATWFDGSPIGVKE